ncbi:MAG: zinc ribbon domain-containing protein [Ruminococcaceae bacterium]|nr:zinc ribbon domain-containing protein [Oscillospiraceae bacterium]
MITCPKCNKELSEGAKFCDNCGTQVFETIFCSNCGTQTSTEFAFCQSCGASITETPAEEQPAADPVEKKKLPKKAIMFGGIGVAVVAVLILVISLFSGGDSRKGENNYALYLKDSEIFFTNLKEDSESWQLTSRLVDTDDVDDEDLADSSYYLGLYTCMSEDGKYIFFPDKVGDDDGFNLYYREVGNPEAEAIKIDSSVVSYTVNSSATLVTYLKGEEGNLYQYNVGEDSKDKIASEVNGFEVSDDGNKIGYINSEGSIYLKYADKDKEKIASEVSSLEYLTADFTTVYYIKDGSLYKQVEGADKVKIASDVYDVIKIYDSGEIYYLTSEAGEISLMDYVTDDMKDADASITEPAYPDYPDSPDSPSWWDYDTDEEYDAAYEAYEQAYAEYEAECDRLYAEYEAAYEAYWAKEYRDELRVDLEEETLEQSSYSLCFYDGSEGIAITDAFVGGYYYYSDYTYASDVPVIAYEAYNQSSLEKVKLSEVESIYDIESMIEAALFSSSERYIAVKGTATVVEQEKEATNFRINSSGTVAYYIDDIPNEKNYGELYCISITDGVVGKAEMYDSDVYTGYCYFVSDTELKYFKDYKDGKGELYINKNKIDYDVEVYYVEVYSDLGKVFYFTDWNDEKAYGTLKVYNGEESVKIADDVHSYSVTPDGRVLYLYDYSLNYYKGELHEWNNGETRKIDDDVVAVLPVFESKYRGYTYGW